MLFLRQSLMKNMSRIIFKIRLRICKMRPMLLPMMLSMLLMLMILSMHILRLLMMLMSNMNRNMIMIRIKISDKRQEYVLKMHDIP